MALAFPNTEAKAFSFDRGEIEIAARIFTAIENISTNQPIEEGVIFGTRAEPLQRTRGQLQMGEGTIEFSAIEEAIELVELLGDGWQEKVFVVSYTLVAPDARTIAIVCNGARLLDCEIDHGQGADGLPASLPFSFMNRTINGKKSLINQSI
jgi:hypothetical protein